MNVYDSPEAFGLTTVAVLKADLSYEFSIVAVWTDGTKFYWQHDEGCSCPIPFERFAGLPDLCTGSYSDLEAFLRGMDSYREWPLTCVMDFLSQVRKAMQP